jgi:plasmid stability protein
MAAMSIRNLDERVMELLRIRAARHGRSMIEIVDPWAAPS